MKPFLHGKKALDAQPLRTPPSHAAAHRGGAAAARPAPVGPQVETIKQGDKIVRLIVTCSCGERIEIDCLYPAGS